MAESATWWWCETDDRPPTEQEQTGIRGFCAEVSAVGPNDAIDRFIDEVYVRYSVRIGESDVRVRPAVIADPPIPHGGDTLATDDPLGQIG